MQLPPLALYIHIPWCVRKCPYCDFNSHEKTELPIAEYVHALITDLQEEKRRAGQREISSIFFGGGTPSLFPAKAIGEILSAVHQELHIHRTAEITLEVNPGTSEYSDFEGLSAAGVNRLSFGAQSFDDLQLQQLGRIHSSEEIGKAISKAKNAGFDNFNIDLMHSLPGQTPHSALRDLACAQELKPTHISWYQLTIEPNTVFYRQPPVLPNDDIQADIFFQGQAFLKQCGYEQYEISAYAQTGHRSRHNINYWRFGDYLALGAGAHGKITDIENTRILRYQKTRRPEDYLNPASPYTSKEGYVDTQDLALEFMMNALRLNSGVESTLFGQNTGLTLAALEPALSQLRAKQLLIPDPTRLQPSEQGRFFLNDILASF